MNRFDMTGKLEGIERRQGKCACGELQPPVPMTSGVFVLLELATKVEGNYHAALDWYYHTLIGEFRDRTACEVVAAGETGALLEFYVGKHLDKCGA